MFNKLPNKKYDIIYADPPWDYKGQTQHTGKGGSSSGGAVNHYPVIKLIDLKSLDVLSIANDNCLLFLWSTSPHLDQAIELGKCWGFDYATVAFVWDKIKRNPGFYTLSQCELCLVFKLGKIPQPRGIRNINQYIKKMRTGHSEKPVEVRRSIDLMFPVQSKIELFARQWVKGWDVWGNSVKNKYR